MESRAYPDLLPADRLTGAGRVLVVAPHPDDEVAACGGMVLHHTRAGDAVVVCFLTDGARGSRREGYDRQYVALREEEARRAARVLGTAPPRFLRLPDGGLHAVPDLASRLGRLVDEVRPKTVYAPSFFEIHPDHRAAAVALLEALGERADPPRVLFGEVGNPVWANLVVDITPVMERKLAALACYRSQLEANDYLPPLKGLNVYRTVNIDLPAVRYVEAYLTGPPEGLRAMLPPVDRIARLARAAALPPDP